MGTGDGWKIADGRMRRNKMDKKLLILMFATGILVIGYLFFIVMSRLWVKLAPLWATQ
jgi:hypothetical protein